MNRMGNVERSAREVAGDMPRETFEKAVEAAAKAVCAHRSYRMIAAEVLASVNHAGAVSEIERLRTWIDVQARACPSASSVDLELRDSRSRFPTTGGQ